MREGVAQGRDRSLCALVKGRRCVSCEAPAPGGATAGRDVVLHGRAGLCAPPAQAPRSVCPCRSGALLLGQVAAPWSPGASRGLPCCAWCASGTCTGPQQRSPWRHRPSPRPPHSRPAPALAHPARASPEPPRRPPAHHPRAPSKPPPGHPGQPPPLGTRPPPPAPQTRPPERKSPPPPRP